MRLHPIAMTVMTLTLAACGGGSSSGGGSSDGSTTPTPTAHDITVVPALGMVKNATVTVTTLDGTAIETPKSTGSTGMVDFHIPAGIEAIIIKVGGGAGAQYFEESANRFEDIPAGTEMRAMALVSHDKQVIAVSPLTEMAVSVANATMGGVHRYSIMEANDYIGSYFDIDNILTPPASIDEPGDYATLTVSTSTAKNATKHALFFSALSQYASSISGSTAQSSLRLMQEMSQDFSDDGILNRATATTYTPGNMPNGLKAALVKFKTDILIANGIELITNMVNPSLDVNSYFDNFLFKINGHINAVEYLTDPGPGIDSTAPNFPKYTVNITAADLTGLTGTFNGKNLEDKDCQVIVGTDGVVMIKESGVSVATEKFDGGNEDSRRQMFDDAGSLTGQYFQARASVDALKTVFLGYALGSGLKIAGLNEETKDETTGAVTKSLSKGCYITP